MEAGETAIGVLARGEQSTGETGNPVPDELASGEQGNPVPDELASGDQDNPGLSE